MPHMIVAPSRTLLPEPLPTIRWSAEQFENLFSMGFLEQGKYELIEGEIIERMPIKQRHAKIITRLFALFSKLYGFERILSAFSLAVNNRSLPEPDFCVTRTDDYALTPHGFVPVDAVQLLVEVSDTTLSTDLAAKANLYARAGIAEYWIVDVTGRRLLIHTVPTTTGYDRVIQYDEADTATITGDAAGAFVVRDLLPDTEHPTGQTR